MIDLCGFAEENSEIRRSVHSEVETGIAAPIHFDSGKEVTVDSAIPDRASTRAGEEGVTPGTGGASNRKAVEIYRYIGC